MDAQISESAAPAQAVREVSPPSASARQPLLTAILRRLLIIGLTVLLSVGAVIGYIWTTKPLYTASAEISLELKTEPVVASENRNSLTIIPGPAYLDSQIEVLKSRRLARTLVRWSRLPDDPEFTGPNMGSVIERLAQYIKPPGWGALSPADRILKTLRNRLTIERVGSTSIIRVTAGSAEPGKAAKLANRLAWLYISDAETAAARNRRETKERLAPKREGLRLSVEKAERTLRAFKQKNNLIGAGKIPSVQGKLERLKADLPDARSEARAALLRRDRMRAAVRTGVRSELVQSLLIGQLEARIDDLQAEEAALVPIYLSSHPTLKEVRQRKSAIQASLRRERERVVRRAGATYNAARKRADKTAAQIRRLEHRLSTSSTATLKLEELQSKFARARSDYEKFLENTKSAWTDARLTGAPARLASAASVPSKPSQADMPMLLGIGLAAGLLLGILAAILLPSMAGSTGRIRKVRQTAPDGSQPAQLEGARA